MRTKQATNGQDVLSGHHCPDCEAPDEWLSMDTVVDRGDGIRQRQVYCVNCGAFKQFRDGEQVIEWLGGE